MTTAQIIQYYSNLLILQYRGCPKARAHIQALVGPIVMDQLPLQVQDAYNLETAVGVQLDVLGKYAGISRVVLNFTGQITLDDDDYRVLIQMKIAQNNSGSSLADIQRVLHVFFPTAIRVYDYQNMHMDYFFDANFGSTNLAEVFLRQGLLPKPMGVELGALIYATNIINMFGFRTYSLPAYNVTGFNNYTDYQTNWTWLSYTMALTL